MNTYSLLNAGRVNAGPGSIDSLKAAQQAKSPEAACTQNC